MYSRMFLFKMEVSGHQLRQKDSALRGIGRRVSSFFFSGGAPAVQVQLLILFLHEMTPSCDTRLPWCFYLLQLQQFKSMSVGEGLASSSGLTPVFVLTNDSIQKWQISSAGGKVGYYPTDLVSNKFL